MATDFLKLAHLNTEARKALANLQLIEKERDRLVGDTRKLADSLKREPGSSSRLSWRRNLAVLGSRSPSPPRGS